jgi:hypothetical protein
MQALNDPDIASAPKNRRRCAITRDMTEAQIKAALRAESRSEDYIKSYLTGWRKVK